MAKTKTYNHYCPIARTLEVIGEKWSLLVVRDLLRGPQRFSDLLKYLGGITPKWLSARLRDLEAAGIVERDSQPGRREVWYRLTDAGRDLAPVVTELLVWGIDHAQRPLLPGEPVAPEQTIMAIATYHNSKKTLLPQPVQWQVLIDDGREHIISFDGERWRMRPIKDESDVTVKATREGWVRFMTTPRSDRKIDGLALDGETMRVREFVKTLGALSPAAVVAG